MKKDRLIILILFLLFAVTVAVSAVIYHRTTPEDVHPPTGTMATVSAVSEGNS